jgi:hypothetical protein
MLMWRDGGRIHLDLEAEPERQGSDKETCAEMTSGLAIATAAATMSSATKSVVTSAKIA